ncbi:hypothetical protein CF326_g6738 [Tilletia indica]|nr:hypothetical protein CF326_g6738 [Tilletia indica]
MRVLQLQGLVLLLSCVLVAGLPTTENDDYQGLARDINGNIPTQSSRQLARANAAVLPRFGVNPDDGAAPGELHETPAKGSPHKPPRSVPEDLANNKRKAHVENWFEIGPNGYGPRPGQRSNAPTQSSQQLARANAAVVPRFGVNPDDGAAPGELYETPAKGSPRKHPRSVPEDLANDKRKIGNAFGFSPNGYATGPGKRN